MRLKNNNGLPYGLIPSQDPTKTTVQDLLRMFHI